MPFTRIFLSTSLSHYGMVVVHSHGVVPSSHKDLKLHNITPLHSVQVTEWMYLTLILSSRWIEFLLRHLVLSLCHLDAYIISQVKSVYVHARCHVESWRLNKSIKWFKEKKKRSLLPTGEIKEKYTEKKKRTDGFNSVYHYTSYDITYFVIL